jgi:hypothetical protein
MPIWLGYMLTDRNTYAHKYMHIFVRAHIQTCMRHNEVTEPIPVATQSKAWVWGRLVAGSADSNPAAGMDVCHLFIFCVVLCR